MGLSLSTAGWPMLGSAGANASDVRESELALITVRVRKDPRCKLNIPGFPASPSRTDRGRPI